MKASFLPLLLLLAACVSQGPQSQLGKQDKAPRRIEMSRTSDCVYQSLVTGFQTLDDRYVVLFASGGRKAYLAETSGGCFDMKNQFQLAAVDGDNNGQICGFGRDSIAYRRIGMVENCRILGLQELSDERRVELGVGAPAPKARKAKKPKPEDGTADPQ
jgi:Family of unknown function (DUF6491)